MFEDRVTQSGNRHLAALYGLFERVAEAWLARSEIVGTIIAFALLPSIYFQALGMSWAANESR